MLPRRVRILPEDSLHPCYDFVTGRIGGLVEVDDTGADVGLEVTLERRSTSRNRSEMTGANEHCAKTRLAMVQRLLQEKGRTLVVVLKQKGPVLSGNGGVDHLWLDGVVHLLVIDGGHRSWWLSSLSPRDQKFVRGNFASAAALVPDTVSARLRSRDRGDIVTQMQFTRDSNLLSRR